MVDNESVAVLLSGRLGVYRILQNALGNEPNVEMLASFADQSTREVLSLFVTKEGEYGRAVGNLFEAAASEKVSSIDFVNQLRDDFTRLFVGPGNVEVEPWESVYLSKDRVLFQPSTLEVRRSYVEQGLLPQNYPKVADDHIALELDFMASLADKALRAHLANDEEERDRRLIAAKAFLEQHLLVWVPAFAEKLRQVPHGQFYCLIGDLLQAYLHEDLEAIEEILQVG